MEGQTLGSDAVAPLTAWSATEDSQPATSKADEKQLAKLSAAEDDVAESLHTFFKPKVYVGVSSMMYLGCVVWNLASPFKSWYLGRFGFTVNDVSMSKGLDWITPIDYGIAKSIYEAAGVALDLPEGRPIRFINIYLDFLVFRKTKTWAHLIGPDYTDFYQTRWCRSTLRDRRSELDKELQKFANGVPFWGSTAVDYVAEQSDCAVAEVSEAIMCLKGYNASHLINLNMKTSLDPHNSDVYAALARYQELQLPDLNHCLARRDLLVGAQGKDKGLQRLAEEMAANYSLDLLNRAGERKLFLPCVMEKGFVDVSGSKSGRRVVQFTGRMGQMPVDMPYWPLHAIRESLWLCSRDDYRPNNWTLYECFDHLSKIFPGFEVATQTDWYTTALKHNPRFTFLRMEGNVSVYEYTYESRAIDPIEYLPDSAISFDTDTETAYRDRVDYDIVKQLFGDYFTTKRGDEIFHSRCFVLDGCFSGCNVSNLETTGLQLNVAYDNGKGGCDHFLIHSAFNTRGYISEKCYGIGKGNHSIVYQFIRPILVDGQNVSQHLINNTAGPFDIFACIVGGRVPGRSNGRMPFQLPALFDTLTNTMMSQTFTRGSEEIFLNSYALVALLGCAIFSAGIVVEVVQVLRLLQRAKQRKVPSSTLLQLLGSMVESNVATCVWEHYHYFLGSFGFVSVMAWYIGAVKTSCSWFLGDRDVWNSTSDDLMAQSQDEPTYICNPGDLNGPFDSFTEVVRLLSISYTVFVLVFQGVCVRGITRSLYTTVVATLCLGFVPTIVISDVITSINRTRISTNRLPWLHNQLFVTILWLMALLLMRLFRSNIVATWSWVWRYIGIRKQPVVKRSTLTRLVGDGYFVTGNEYVRRQVSHVPLSVLLESNLFALEDVDLITRRYRFQDIVKEVAAVRPKGSTVKAINTTSNERAPLSTAVEFYVEF